MCIKMMIEIPSDKHVHVHRQTHACAHLIVCMYAHMHLYKEVKVKRDSELRSNGMQSMVL